MTGVRHQRAALAPRLHRHLGNRGVEGAQGLERRFKGPPEPSKRGRLFLRKLVFERRIGGPDIRDLVRESRRSDSHTFEISVQAALDNSFSIAAITRGSVGSTCVAKLAAMCPSRPIKYLWKFQRGNSSGFSAAAHL